LQKARYIGVVHSGIITKLIGENRGVEAFAYFNEANSKGQINREDVEDLKTHTRAASINSLSHDLSTTIIAGGGTLDEQIARVMAMMQVGSEGLNDDPNGNFEDTANSSLDDDPSDNLNSEIRAETITRLKVHDATQKRQRQEAIRKQVEGFWTGFSRSPDVNAIPVTLPPETRQTAMTYAVIKASGGQPETDPAVFDRLTTLTDDELAAVNLYEHRNTLSDRDFNALTEEQQAAINSAGKSQGVGTIRQQIQRSFEKQGLSGDANITQRSALHRAITGEVTLEAERLKRGLSYVERQEIVDQVMGGAEGGVVADEGGTRGVAGLDGPVASADVLIGGAGKDRLGRRKLKDQERQKQQHIEEFDAINSKINALKQNGLPVSRDDPASIAEIEEVGKEILRIMPITGNVMSAVDAYYSFQAAIVAAEKGDWSDAGIQAALGVVDAVGVAPGGGLLVRGTKALMKRLGKSGLIKHILKNKSRKPDVPGNPQKALDKPKSDGSEPFPPEGKRPGPGVNNKSRQNLTQHDKRFVNKEHRKQVQKRVDDGVPLGFESRKQVEDTANQFSRDAKAAGVDDAEFAIMGSSVTGKKFNSKTGMWNGKGFDDGRTSDYDFAIVSPGLLATARKLGIELRTGRTRTGKLRSDQIKELGLEDLVKNARAVISRPHSFIIYGSQDAIAARAPYIMMQ